VARTRWRPGGLIRRRYRPRAPTHSSAAPRSGAMASWTLRPERGPRLSRRSGRDRSRRAPGRRPVGRCRRSTG
jgi:hypothetical protein